MVISSDFRMEKHRDDGHEEGAPNFSKHQKPIMRSELSYHWHKSSELRDQRRYGKVIQHEGGGRKGSNIPKGLGEAMKNVVAPFAQPTAKNRKNSIGINSINES